MKTASIHIAAIFLALLSSLVLSASAMGSAVEYELTIAEKKVNITGKPVTAMTINGTIPGPILRFKKGDLARIRVHNKMTVETSIHWHGVLVPPGMDGVPYISFPPIAPGTTFTYEFPVRHSGTYWYHSHTGLQEQRGVYGSIVFEPEQPRYKPDRDHVILLSDWTDQDPHSVIRTLKRGSEWYSIEKGGGQSIIGAAKTGMLGDYAKRELQRMPPMDISDVAYDRFLANGKPSSLLESKSGEMIRLRIINGSATTYFHLEFSGGPMSIISADGMDVMPVSQKRFLIGVAETYDVMIRIPENGSYEFRATAHDGSAYASVWFSRGDRHPAPEVPEPNLYHAMGDLKLKNVLALTPAGSMGMPDRMVNAGAFDKPGMAGMGGMDMGMGGDMDSTHSGHGGGAMESTNVSQGGGSMEMNQGASPTGTMTGHDNHQTGMSHTMDAQSDDYMSGRRFGNDYRFLASDISSAGLLAADGDPEERPWPPYEFLRSVHPTAFRHDRPVREIRLTLDGDMERYVWLLNNKPLSESDSIRIRKGEITRFIMINRTMMHHPMHLHGHFFRVINGQGDYAPLKHTVNVAPMSTTVIEFDANEFGDWFFHCHLLYHMKSGMARMVHYEGYTAPDEVAAIRTNLYKDSWYFWGHANLLSNMTFGDLTFASTRYMVMADWESGWQDVDDWEWEGTLTAGYSVNRFLTLFAGAYLEGVQDNSETPRGIAGFNYLLPMNLGFQVWVDNEGGARLTLEKEFELSPRLVLYGDVGYDTREDWEGQAGVSYMINKNFSAMGQWHTRYGWGAGLEIRF